MTLTLLKSPVQGINAPTLHHLSNGLTIVAEQVPVDAVTLSIWLNVGSAVESDSINGTAHFLEHMIFRGTSLLQGGEFEREVESRGAVTNAATSQDYTYYYITTAPHDFASLAPLQLEVVLNASINEVAFDRERQVVLEEIRRAQDNPRRRVFQAVLETAFERLPYRRPVLGQVDAIAQLTAQQMQAFHRTTYQPGNMTLSVVGNLPVAELVEIAKTSAEQALQRQSPVDCAPGMKLLNSLDFSAEAPLQAPKRQEIIDSSLRQARLVMAWRVPGMIEAQRTYGLDVLASILGYGRTARMVRDLRENRRLVSNLSVSNLTYAHQGLFYISAQLPTENLAEVEAAILEHIHQLRSQPVTEVELNRVKTQVANQHVFANESPSDRASLYGYHQSQLGDLFIALRYPDLIQALNAADLQRSAQTYLSPEAYTLVAVRPEE